MFSRLPAQNSRSVMAGLVPAIHWGRTAAWTTGSSPVVTSVVAGHSLIPPRVGAEGGARSFARLDSRKHEFYSSNIVNI